MADKTFTALMMAANRPGIANPVAALQGKTHKAQVTIAGKNMMSRIMDTLMASRHIGRIVVSVEDPAAIEAIPEVAALMKAGRVTTVPSEASLFRSLRRAMQELGEGALPMIVVTADIPLLRTEMVDDFCEQMLAGDADLAIGMAPMDLAIQRFPEAASTCTFHEFRDGRYTTCNIYGVGDGNALKVARVLETGGQFRKKRWRIVKAFGLVSFFMYVLKLRTFAGVMDHIGKRFGVTVRGIVLNYAEAGIDVDNAPTFHLAEAILQRQDQHAA